MKISVNKLNVELRDISTAHDQVNTYFWGDFGMAINSGVITYPLVNCFYPTGSMLDNTTPLDLFIVVSDKVYKDQSNLTETESDTLQVCRDYYNVINKSDRWNRIGKINNATITKFLHEGRNGADEVAGHVLKISFALRDSNSICNIPLTGYDFEGTPINVSCADAVVKNSDLTYIQNIISGGVLTLPDTTLNIYVNEVLNESVTFATLSNQTINITN